MGQPGQRVPVARVSGREGPNYALWRQTALNVGVGRKVCRVIEIDGFESPHVGKQEASKNRQANANGRAPGAHVKGLRSSSVRFCLS